MRRLFPIILFGVLLLVFASSSRGVVFATSSRPRPQDGAPPPYNISITMQDSPYRVVPESIELSTIDDLPYSFIQWLDRPKKLLVENTSPTENHRLVIMTNDTAQIDAVLRAAAADPTYAPPMRNGVWLSTPVFTPGQGNIYILSPLPVGTYRYFCTVPGHMASGMQGTLRVVARKPTLSEIHRFWYDLVAPLVSTTVLLLFIAGSRWVWRPQMQIAQPTIELPQRNSHILSAFTLRNKTDPYVRFVIAFVVLLLSCSVGGKFGGMLLALPDAGVPAAAFLAGVVFALLSGLLFAAELQRPWILSWIIVSIIGMMSAVGLTYLLIGLAFQDRIPSTFLILLGCAAASVLLSAGQVEILRRQNRNGREWSWFLVTTWTGFLVLGMLLWSPP